MVQALDKKEWQPLQMTLPLLLGILESLVQDKQNPEHLQDALEDVIETSGIEPAFFNPALDRIVPFVLQLVTSKGAVEDSTRQSAFEWVVTIAEQKKDKIIKTVPNAPVLMLEACLKLLFEVDDTETDLKQWIERLDDEEGEEDEEEMYHVGQEMMD